MNIRISYMYVALFFAFSCKNEDLTKQPDQQIALVQNDQEAKVAFGKSLAGLMTNKEVREIIKQEALKKFDEDYDVLFNTIQDVPLKDGKTLLQHLTVIDPNMPQIVDQLPLLTIFVPELPKFSAETWKTETEIPRVVVRNLVDKAADNPAKAYDAKGNTLDLDYHKDPDIPVVVVKDNERIVTSDEYDPNALQFKNATSSAIKKHSFLNKSTDRNLADVYPAREAGTADTSPLPPFFLLDEKLIYACTYQLNSQRDYIYYGIDSTKNITSGTLNSQFAEHIISIQLENESVFNKINDFTEGDFEFVITILIPVRDNGSPLKFEKHIFCKKTDLKGRLVRDGNGNSTYQMLEFSGFPPIEITIWDNYNYGNTWTFSAYEYDDGTKTTISNTVGSSFTTGISGTFTPPVNGVRVKIGATNISNSVTTNSSSTVTIETTNNSDELGSGALDYRTPIYKRHLNGRSKENPGPITVRDAPPSPYFVTTGAIKIRIEPRKRY